MEEITGLEAMRRWARAERQRGRRIGFVPTMGALHEGHLRLVDRARDLADRVVLSIFVNPMQFGPNEDLDRYPRDLPRDRELAASRGVDALFVPEAAAMYPAPAEVRVAPGPPGDVFEGSSRPGHFAGVLTVVAKLLHLVEPDLAVFGRKDFQQAMLVRRMVRDLNFPVELDVHPTIRELDGLALSSRNAYLSPDDRRAALALSRALRAVEQAWRGGEADPRVLERRGLDVLHAPSVEAEYFALVVEQLRRVERADARSVAITAARVGPGRLIDNVVLGEGLAADPTVRR
jgi:pantoate--beta-alanine ligase